MRLISPVNPSRNSLASPSARAISSVCDSVYSVPEIPRKALSKILSRSKMDNLIDIYLKRYAKGKETLIFRSVLPRCALASRKNIVVDGVPNMSEFVRLALKEYAYYGMKMNEYYFHRILVQRKTLDNSEKIIVMSDYAKKSFEREGYEDITNIKIGVDTERFTPGRGPPENFQVIVVASITPMKGIRYLVDAWKKEPFPLKIVGDIPYDIKKTIPKEIELTGFADPLQHYRESSCFVFPSLSEGFGKTILEAMSCGIPVITTENTGGPDVVGKRDGIIIPIKDPKAIRSAIQYMQDNPKDAMMMGRHARKTAESFRWDSFTERLERAVHGTA